MDRRTLHKRWIGLLLIAVLAATGIAFANHEQESEGAVPFQSPLTSEPAQSPAQGADESNPLDVLSKLLPGASRAATNSEFLDPDVAYVLTMDAIAPDTVVARWDIADGYYMYREKFLFDVVAPAGIELGEVSLPPGTEKVDEYFGRMEVYYQSVEATIPLDRPQSGPADLTLSIGYQGCADAGLCYPPMRKEMTVSLPGISDASTEAAPGNAAGASSGSRFVTEQDRLAGVLGSGRLWLALGSFFGLGLLLAFTPCVLPTIPILSAILVGSGSVSRGRSFTLSLVYVLAMAIAYTAAGIAAGLFGSNLQAAFQHPWVIGVSSAVFALLALAMFGVYQLQVPVTWQTRLVSMSNRMSGGTVAGVATIGLLSALIIGPCMAAPLAGALIYIGQTGDAVLGGAALFAMSLGMGVPLLMIGASAGKLLPKAGPWMDVVKSVIGVLLLGMAIYLLDRIVPGEVTMLLWAALLITVAIYLGALDMMPAGTSGWRRLWKGAGVVAMVYGVSLIIGALSGTTDMLRPLRGLVADSARAPESALAFKPVKGLDELNAEIRLASAQGRPVMLDFYADWCITCKELERFTFTDPSVQTALAGTVLLRTDVTANDERDQALLRAFGLYGPPTILFFGPDGRERSQYRLMGYMNAKDFRELVVAALGATAI